MQKLIYSFFDSNVFEIAAKFEKIGFEVSLDDKANNVYYAQIDLSDFDLLNIMQILDDCKSIGLDGLIVQIGDDNYWVDDKNDFKAIDSIIAANPNLI